jgi:hypothetical protein
VFQYVSVFAVEQHPAACATVDDDSSISVNTVSLVYHVSAVMYWYGHSLNMHAGEGAPVLKMPHCT